jgi:hypothetical protein
LKRPALNLTHPRVEVQRDLARALCAAGETDGRRGEDSL